MDGNHWYDASVDAGDGELVHLTDWVSHASYNVLPTPLESPNFGDRSLEVDPHEPVASPSAWHDTDGVAGAEFTTTQGNNVHAYADRDGNGVPDPGSSPDGGASLIFDFPFDTNAEPITYRDAAVVNLFYWNTSFTTFITPTASTKRPAIFRRTTTAAGARGNDAVRAEAQDNANNGSANNANFATPPDGNAPRMQMFEFTRTSPRRDSDFDNGIIIHEYGHGVSNRLTGGPANSGRARRSTKSRDGRRLERLAFLMLTQDSDHTALQGRGVGTYVLGQQPDGPGVRSQRYSYDMSINTLTYANVATQGIPHGVGEIWASVLWDLNWALIGGSSLDANLPNIGLGFDPDFIGGTGGNNLAMQLVMDGMKLQPANPSFLDARDAILQADQVLNGGANQDVIWAVFARRGMGFSAFDGGNADNTNVTEAFDIPATSTGSIELDFPATKSATP